ncbi:hypothetical protein [uncultured Gammaproteobacteria bacterium]|jgi:hypothetical protein|nr:hypothetical protein [uncultured Gammaproteobacteria bacterium]CAC9628696.1 hypothetical protein [uncultured Gammaproteobacteria bacterium]CAC9978161.1 hypothetical protein [uncultured Gammaproteobacteria bacterium]
MITPIYAKVSFNKFLLETIKNQHFYVGFLFCLKETFICIEWMLSVYSSLKKNNLAKNKKNEYY